MVASVSACSSVRLPRYWSGNGQKSAECGVRHQIPSASGHEGRMQWTVARKYVVFSFA